jgi:predicted transcriptional regulator
LRNYLAGTYVGKSRFCRSLAVVARMTRGLSQLALAGRAGISQRHLSFLELGRAKPSRDMIGQIAKVLEAVKNNPESTER